jgi:hypothetical protein
VEGLVVLPDGPDDPGELVGEGGGGLVVTASVLSCESPGAESVGTAALGGEQDGACAVDEEGSEVDVSSLGDPAESAS